MVYSDFRIALTFNKGPWCGYRRPGRRAAGVQRTVTVLIPSSASHSGSRARIDNAFVRALHLLYALVALLTPAARVVFVVARSIHVPFALAGPAPAGRVLLPCTVAPFVARYPLQLRSFSSRVRGMRTRARAHFAECVFRAPLPAPVLPSPPSHLDPGQRTYNRFFALHIDTRQMERRAVLVQH